MTTHETPRITTSARRPNEAFIHLPEFTYWDTQAWSAELGIPAAHLPALRDAITAHLAAVATEPEPGFGVEGCTCKPFTHQGGTRYLDQPSDTVDMIGGWEINDCPHHKRRTAAPAVGEQPHA